METMSLTSRRTENTYCQSPQFYEDTRKLRKYKRKIVSAFGR